jgi:hypothetical protein
MVSYKELFLHQSELCLQRLLAVEQVLSLSIEQVIRTIMLLKTRTQMSEIIISFTS